MPDFSPLSSGNPFPADWSEIHEYGTLVAQTGELIADSVALLRRCADENNWETETADAFREKAEDLANDIDKTRGRYENVGAKLKQIADSIELHEGHAARHAYLARQEESDAGTSEATPGTGPDGAEVPLTPEQTAANSRRSAAIREIRRLQGLFDDEVDRAREAAENGAEAIKGYLDDDVKDSWWDRNAGWLKIVKTVLTVIIVIAAIVILTVATGGTIWLIAVGVSVAAGLLSLGISIGLASSGNGSWWDVAFDAVGVLTLGAGGLLTKLGTKGLPALRAGYSSFQGSMAFMRTMSGFRAGMIRLLGHVPFSGGLVRTLSSGLIDDAFDAQAAARALADTLPDVGRLSSFFNGGREGATTLAQTSNILADLRGLGNVPSYLADDAARLLDDAGRIDNLLVNANRLANAGSISTLAEAGYTLGSGALDFDDPAKTAQVIVDLIGRLG